MSQMAIMTEPYLDVTLYNAPTTYRFAVPMRHVPTRLLEPIIKMFAYDHISPIQCEKTTMSMAPRTRCYARTDSVVYGKPHYPLAWLLAFREFAMRIGIVERRTDVKDSGDDIADDVVGEHESFPPAMERLCNALPVLNRLVYRPTSSIAHRHAVISVEWDDCAHGELERVIEAARTYEAANGPVATEHTESPTKRQRPGDDAAEESAMATQRDPRDLRESQDSS